MREDMLKIGYAGTLIAYRPGREKPRRFQGLLDWFWTYRIRDIHYHTRSGYYLIQGVRRFKEKYPALAGRLEVRLWGLVEPDNAAQAREAGVDGIVHVEGYFPKRESAARIQASDVLFLPLETGDDPLFIPGKIFDYIRQGKPVLILGHRSDCTDILVRAGLGILVDPFDADAIAETLKGLMVRQEALGEWYRVDWEYVESHFHFKNLARQLGEVFEEVGRT